ncbi:MAG: hypothetical protein ACOCQU_02510 [Halolamina sp.]
MLARIALGIIVGILVVTGGVAVVKPEWVAVFDRRYKAAGTTLRPEEVELTEIHYLVVRLVGIGMVLTGLVYSVRLL